MLFSPTSDLLGIESAHIAILGIAYNSCTLSIVRTAYHTATSKS